MQNIKIKKINPNAIIPRKATDGAVAYDIYIPCDYRVRVGRQVLPLGIAIELPIGYEAKIEPRSGHASKGMEGVEMEDYRQHNHSRTYRYDCDALAGKIDPDYRGELGVILNNHDRPFMLLKGSRIAQMTIYRVEPPAFIEVDRLEDSARGSGGFGHTGTISEK